MALIDRLIADLVESSQAAAPPADPVDVLRQLIELSVDVLATRPVAYSAKNRSVPLTIHAEPSPASARGLRERHLRVLHRQHADGYRA